MLDLSYLLMFRYECWCHDVLKQSVFHNHAEFSRCTEVHVICVGFWGNDRSCECVAVNGLESSVFPLFPYLTFLARISAHRMLFCAQVDSEYKKHITPIAKQDRHLLVVTVRPVV